MTEETDMRPEPEREAEEVEDKDWRPEPADNDIEWRVNRRSPRIGR